MRIFYASDHTPNASMPESRLWYNNLFLPLVDLGHEVIPFEYNLTPHYNNLDLKDPKHIEFIKTNRPKLESALLEQIKKVHCEKSIDVFFSYFYSACCLPEIIKEIGNMGICTINWFCNASYQFYLIEEIAPAYHYCLVPEKFRLDDYRRIGANPIYLQEAANPNIYKPYDLPQDYDVTFVGQRYGDRPEYISHLFRQGIDIHVWGWGWKQNYLKQYFKYLLKGRDAFPLPNKNTGLPLSDEDLIRMYSRSIINLGFSSCGETHKTDNKILQIRLRDFEIPMSGAFYMTEYMQELEEFFETGKEIVCYNGKYDLAEKIKFYLAHPQEREKIRHAGYRRAISEHTWQKRFEKLFKDIGLQK